jgi:superfamily I DNA/RNA helicase
MKATTKNLREGECALINDGTLDELKKVLKAAFPNDDDTWFHPEAHFYWKYGNLDAWQSASIWPSDYRVIPKFSIKEFIKNMKQEQKVMKNRTLKPEDAQSIINIACKTWKVTLAEEWAQNIVMQRDITISEDFYKRMRSACTAEQNKLFDEIFGKDVELVELVVYRSPLLSQP